MTYAVRKLFKRLHIVEDDNIVYTPPDFVQIKTRQQLDNLADEFNKHGYNIQAIMDFETSSMPYK